MKKFNDWIADLEVEDVPCVGRKCKSNQGHVEEL